MTTDAVGGVWSYAMTLARGLRALDVDVTLAATGPRPSAARAEEAVRAGVTLHHGPFPLEWMPDADRELDAAGEWLLDLARSVRPDVVHVNGYAHAALPWDAPVLAVAHSSVTTWWHAVHGAAPPDGWNAYAERVTRGLDAADAVVAPTRAFAGALRAHHDHTRPVRVIPNAVDTPPAPATRKRNGVLAVGRFWDPAKDLATLDIAAARVPWRVHVAGDALDPVTGDAAKARHARLLGHVDAPTLRKHLGEAAVFAHPALYEPFGLAPLEAAHAGAALVLADLPTLREVWGDAATFVPPRDPDALADALRALAEDPALRRDRQERARARAQGFDARAFASAYAGLYAELAGSGAAGADQKEQEEKTACAS